MDKHNSVIMISTTKQNWNRITLIFLTTSIVQVIIEYGKIVIDRKCESCF